MDTHGLVNLPRIQCKRRLKLGRRPGVTSDKTKQLTNRLKNLDRDVKAPDALKDKIRADIKKSK